jgi:hypothetical protein
MIIETLVVIAIILIIGHVFVHFSIDKKNYEKQDKAWSFEKEAMQISRGINNVEENTTTKKVDHDTEIILPVSKPRVNEKSFMDYGKVIANEQKVKILNHRIDNLERALSELASKKINNPDVDIERIEFKIKVIENQIEEIKNPKPKENTFYGKKDDPLEKEIRSLVFNSKKK